MWPGPQLHFFALCYRPINLVYNIIKGHSTQHTSVGPGGRWPWTGQRPVLASNSAHVCYGLCHNKRNFSLCHIWFTHDLGPPMTISIYLYVISHTKMWFNPFYTNFINFVRVDKENIVQTILKSDTHATLSQCHLHNTSCRYGNNINSF